MLVSCHHHDHRKQLKRERMYVGTFQKASVHPRGESFVVEMHSRVCLQLCGPESNESSRNQGPGLTLENLRPVNYFNQ